MSMARIAAVAMTIIALPGCIAPGVEAGGVGMLTRAGAPPGHFEPGYGSTLGVSLTPPSRSGPVIGLEGQVAEDGARGATGTGRLKLGYSFAPGEGTVGLEPTLDLGTRVDGGLFLHPVEGGARLSVVVPLDGKRTMRDRNDAFVWVSRNVDVVPYARVGFHADPHEQPDISAGALLRVWAWTDIF
jgi:hypothetical protein